MRVIVCGSRNWRDRQAIAHRLADLPNNATVVHGGAKGADRIAHQEAQKLGLLVEEHRPDYTRHSQKLAPLRRNEKMAALGADLCIAFWRDGSWGTWHMQREASNAGIPVEVVTPALSPTTGDL